MEHTGIRTNIKWRQSLTVALVMFCVGIMFAISANLNRGSNERHPENFKELVEQEVQRVNGLSSEVEYLQGNIKELSSQFEPTTEKLSPEELLGREIVTGEIALSGPGLRVELWDVQDRSYLNQDFSPDDLVVHQQDLEAVVNALWQGGAEAITLQGQRVTPNSAFRCVGNVLALHGRVYSPPYVIEAVGEPDKLSKGLEKSQQVQVYMQYVDAVGMGWKLTKLDEIEIPTAASSTNLDYAKVLEGTVTSNDGTSSNPS